MTVAALDAHNLGFAIGALIIPLIGLILLIVGTVERARSQKQPPPMPPGYPAQASPPAQFGPPYPPPPPGYGPQAPPGYPPATYAPGAPPYPPPPGHWQPPPRPKPRGTALIVTGAVILGLSLLGGVGRASMSGSSTDSDLGRPDADKSLTVGQCVADDEFGKGAPEPIDCSNSIATMELASRGGANADCPDGKGRDDTDYTTLFWEDATMCFAANLIERNCYAVNMESTPEAPFISQACSNPRATIKVVQRFDGTTDAAHCPAGTKPVSYPQPARLYCIEPAR